MRPSARANLAAPAAARRGVYAAAARPNPRIPIELRQLRYFVRIVDIGSLSRAAAVIHVAQSALSQQIAALEDELGVALLQRSRRGVQPTPAGERLYRHAQALLQQAGDTRVVVTQGLDQPAGVVSLGIPLSLAGTLAWPVFEAVRAAYPRVRLHVTEAASATVLEWVASGRLNLGIVFDNGNLAGLQTAALFDEHLYLATDPQSDLACRMGLDLAELAVLPLVLPAPGMGVRPALEQALACSGLQLAAPCAELNSMALLKQAARCGLGPTVFGWASIADDIELGRLAAVAIERPPVCRRAVVCRLPGPGGEAEQAVLLTVVDTVREQVRRASWRGVTLPPPQAQLPHPVPPLQASASPAVVSRALPPAPRFPSDASC